MVDESIVAVTKEYLCALRNQGIAVRFGVVFGSWAKGMAHRWSDIDLVVVSPQFDCSHTWTDVRVLWRQAAHRQPHRTDRLR